MSLGFLKMDRTVVNVLSLIYAVLYYPVAHATSHNGPTGWIGATIGDPKWPVQMETTTQIWRTTTGSTGWWTGATRPGPTGGTNPARNVRLQATGIWNLTSATTVRGRLEVYMHNLWGLVCADGFDDTAALVACKEIGFQYGKALEKGSYGYNSKYTWLNHVNCTGDERSLLDCSYSDVSCPYPPYHNNYATVICSKRPLADTYSLELYGSSLRYTGRVRVRRFGIYGKVCGDPWGGAAWNDAAARVACRQLGYASGVAFQYADSSAGYKAYHPWISSISCTGQESSISKCNLSAGFHWGCSRLSRREAGVLCYQNSGVKYRLSGGANNHGRVEIMYDGRWGTVCDSSWSSNDARVICRQMGYVDGLVKKYSIPNP